MERGSCIIICCVDYQVPVLTRLMFWMFHSRMGRQRLAGRARLSDVGLDAGDAALIILSFMFNWRKNMGII